jgi:lysophospholipase L1-like esterase
MPFPSRRSPPPLSFQAKLRAKPRYPMLRAVHPPRTRKPTWRNRRAPLPLQRWQPYGWLALFAVLTFAFVAWSTHGGRRPLHVPRWHGRAPKSAHTTKHAPPRTIAPHAVAAPKFPVASVRRRTLRAQTIVVHEESRRHEPTWAARHARELRAVKAPMDVMLLGDSITQGWEFEQRWAQHFPDLRAVNAGIASDRVEHILYRVRDGLFAAEKPKVVVLLAGVNNLAMSSPEYVAAGLGEIVAEIRRRSPDTKILLLGIFPSGEMPQHMRRGRAARVNQLLPALADGQHVFFQDFGARLVEANGKISRAVMFDFLHLTGRGYDVWADAMGPKLRGLLPRART